MTPTASGAGLPAPRQREHTPSTMVAPSAAQVSGARPAMLRSLGRHLEGWLRPRLQRSPQETVSQRQERVLRRIVRRNRHSTFGLQHGFGTLHSCAEYVRRLPVMDDTALLRWLRYRAEQDPRALTPAPRSWREAAAAPLVCDDAAPARVRTQLDGLLTLCPGAFAGAVLITVRQEAAEWTTARRALREAALLPQALWEIDDSALRELLMLRLALARADLTCLAGLDARGLQRWMRSLEVHHRHLLKDLRQGGFFLAARLPAELAARLAPALAACPERARALAHRRREAGTLSPRDLWPGLALWVTPPSPPLETLDRDSLPADVRLVARAFESDPLRRAVASPAEDGACLPRVDCHYYEFAPCRAWDAGERATLGVAQLDRGEHYYLIISGERGLYRYFTGDVLTVTGWQGELPLLRFLSAPPAVRSAYGLAASTTPAPMRTAAQEKAA